MVVMLFTAILTAGLSAGCQPRPAERVVLYCSQDREYAESILAEFTMETGIQVELRGDTEANKSVGLYEALVREARQPRCDVFWCNEPILMQRLADGGILESYSSPMASSYPDWTRPADRTWQAFAARGRVLIVNNKVTDQDTPKTLEDLLQPKWKKRWAMAKPFYGTTATHAACLWTVHGEARARIMLQQMADSAVVLAGNRDVAQAVADGQLDLGLTDTDDAIVLIEKKAPVRIAYLQDGTLFLPNTLGLIRNAPHRNSAIKLIDYLLSIDVEKRLALGPSAQIPLNPRVKLDKLRVKTPGVTKPLEVNYADVARQWESVQTYLRSVFRD
jgi:iron(III) transport system substrate-binding protein